MVEAYKIILRESGSVRRAEDLARRMKQKSDQKPKPQMSMLSKRVVSEELDKMEESLKSVLTQLEPKDEGGNHALRTKTDVKLARTRRETRVMMIFKGSLEETEQRLQKVYSALAGA